MGGLLSADSQHSSRAPSSPVPLPDASADSEHDRQARTAGAQSQTTRFEFVDVSSTNARRQARAHVMREFMRQRRKERNDGVDPVDRPKPEDLAASTELIRKPVKSKLRFPKDRQQSTDHAEEKVAFLSPDEPKPKKLPPTSDFQGPEFSAELQLAEQKGLVRKGWIESYSLQSSSNKDSFLPSASTQSSIPDRSNSRSPVGRAQSPLTMPSRYSTHSFPVVLDDEDVPLVDHCLLFNSSAKSQSLLIDRQILQWYRS